MRTLAFVVQTALWCVALQAHAGELYGGGGTTGFELGFAQPFADRFAARIEFNSLRVTRDYNTSGVDYDAKVKFNNDVNVAPLLFGSTNSDASSQKLALGYVYNLSKRSAVYATIARLTNTNGASQALGGVTTSPNHGSNGTEFGMRHAF